MQKSFFAALLGAALVMPLAAHAEGSYFKASVGRSEYKAGDFNEGKTAASLAYGFSVDKNFDVELGYVNFGKLKFADPDGPGSFHAQSIYLAGVGNLPLTDAFSVFGKLGVAVNHFKDVSTDLSGSSSSQETKARGLLGVGLAYNFTKEFTGTLEYQHFGKVDNLKMSAVTVGIKYGF